MWFLFLQIWVWLLIAFVLGWLAHWFFCCRGKEASTSVENNITNTNFAPAPAAASVSSVEAEPPAVEVSDDWKPMMFSDAPEQQDDLKQIKGIGQVLEGVLQGLGVYQFKQIAEWDDNHVAWMDNYLAFPGRIDREDWREQAKILAGGGKTDFANRVEKGDVEY